ncbi:MAG: hypothetical protein ACRD03_02355, partial [Acidimicrobiales bacterium]
MAATVANGMRDDPRCGMDVGLLARPRPALRDRLDGAVYDGVRRWGFAHLAGVLAAGQRAGLIDEARAAGGRFLALPERVNGIDQCADQLTLRAGDAHHPWVNELCRAVVDGVAGWPAASGAAAFRPTEARYMRYTGGRVGLGPHVDGKFYRMLVFVFSLAGSAEFRLAADGSGPAADLVVRPGDLLVMRAPG